MLRFLTAGESHGKALLGILEGMPAGLKIDKKFIDKQLTRRQSGYGRGGRMKIEKDRVQIISGVKKSMTLGSPIGLIVANKDAKIDKLPALYAPRPGHGDLVGGLKYGFSDLRCVLERASARETAMRVAIGAICSQLLNKFKIKVSGRVASIHGEARESWMKKAVDRAKQKRDTIGGVFEVMVKGVPIGLGSYVHWDRRLDAKLAMGLMSIPAIKAVEIGLGSGCANRYGSQVHDAIYFSKDKGFYRETNNAGGIEAGVSNGEDIVLRACMKPISTIGTPLDSVDIRSKRSRKAGVERYDTCAVNAASVVGEAVVAFQILSSFMEKFGSDSVKDISSNLANYLKRIK